MSTGADRLLATIRRLRTLGGVGGLPPTNLPSPLPHAGGRVGGGGLPTPSPEPASPGGVGGLPPTNSSSPLPHAGGGAGGGGPSPFKPEPTNAFEIAIAQRLKDLEEEIDRLRTQLNWLLLFIVAAALSNVVISILK